jgi:hypothetical protein
MSPKSSGERGLEPPIELGGGGRRAKVDDIHERRALPTAVKLMAAVALVVLLAIIAIAVF